MSQHDESKKNPKDLINKYFDGVLPIKDGKFTADLLRSHISPIFPSPNGELSKFRRTEDRSQHNTYGMTQQERDDAVINYSKEKACLVDKNGTPVNVDHRIYNVTADKKLICRPDNLSPFNHSSITRDGAIECAGHITIKDGIITAINNSSGHYKPTSLDLYNAINTIHKYDKNVFAEKCIIEMHHPEHGQIRMNMDQFKQYMHETITNAKGELVPRVAQMRIDRYEANRAIPSISHKFNQDAGDSLEDIIMKAPAISYVQGAKHLYTFPRELFDKNFQDHYYQKNVEGMSDEYKDSRTTITLDSNQLLNYLSERGSDAAIKKLLSGYAQTQVDITIPAAAHAPTMLNHHASTAQPFEQATQPLRFDQMEVCQIRDLYNSTTPQIKSEIFASTNTYSPKSAELCGWIVQAGSMYEVDHVNTANEVLTNMLGWDKKDIQASKEIKNILTTNSYFVGFGEHCENPQVKTQFFDKMAKLAVIAGVKFEDLAKYNRSEDTVQQLKKSYDLAKGVHEAAQQMAGHTTTTSTSVHRSPASTARGASQHFP